MIDGQEPPTASPYTEAELDAWARLDKEISARKRARLKMETFVVLTSDDKYGTLDPDIIGPFEDEDAAIRFTELLPERTGEDGGGYAGEILVNARTATSPEEAYRQWDVQDDWL